MANLAIKGHATRGNEVIEILEMLGGKNIYQINNTETNLLYCLREVDNVIIATYPNGFITNVFTLEEFLEKFPYKVGDKVIDIKTNRIVEIYKMHWSESNNCTYYDVKHLNNTGCVRSYKFLQPYKEETMENKPDLLQQLKDYFDNTPREVVEKEWHEYDKYNEIGPTVNEYLEYVNKIRQPQYPKTFVECCRIMGFCSDTLKWNNPFCINRDTHPYIKHFDNLIESFCKLLIYRDAYWKIAGERMGLDKPWIQDYDDRCFIIANNNGNIHTYEYHGTDNVILAFPTKEMREAFYENFKELIEECKELL